MENASIATFVVWNSRELDVNERLDQYLAHVHEENDKRIHDEYTVGASSYMYLPSPLSMIHPIPAIFYPQINSMVSLLSPPKARLTFHGNFIISTALNIFLNGEYNNLVFLCADVVVENVVRRVVISNMRSL